MLKQNIRYDHFLPSLWTISLKPFCKQFAILDLRQFTIRLHQLLLLLFFTCIFTMVVIGYLNKNMNYLRRCIPTSNIASKIADAFLHNYNVKENKSSLFDVHCDTENLMLLPHWPINLLFPYYASAFCKSVSDFPNCGNGEIMTL